MTILYVVIGSRGEYSDREEYVAGVFENKVTACNLIQEKTALGRRRALDRQKWIDTRCGLVNEAKKTKRNLVTQEDLAYYGEEYLPSRLRDLTPEEQAIINEKVGPIPRAIEYDTFYVVSVPVNKWGQWSEFDGYEA